MYLHDLRPDSNKFSGHPLLGGVFFSWPWTLLASTKLAAVSGPSRQRVHRRLSDSEVLLRGGGGHIDDFRPQEALPRVEAELDCTNATNVQPRDHL